MAKKATLKSTHRKAKKKKAVAKQKAKDKNSTWRNKHGKRDKLKTKKVVPVKKKGKLRRASSKSKAAAPSGRENLRRHAENESKATESIADAVAEGIAEVESDVTGPVPLAEEFEAPAEGSDHEHFDEDAEVDEDASDDEGYF